MRASLIALILVLAAVLSLPWLGPAMGWDDYRHARRAPERRVELSGGHFVNVKTLGNGPAIVLVHGLPGDAAQLGELAEAFARRGFQTHIYDRVGWGHSSRRDSGEPATLEQNGRELVELAAALDLGSAIWLGYSFGGGIVQHAAARAPDQVRGLVLLSSVGPAHGRPSPGWMERWIFSLPVLAFVHSTGGLARTATAGAMASLFAPEMEPPPHLVDRFLAGTSMPGARNTWLREGRGERTHAAERVRTRAILIHGTGDKNVPIEVGRDLARRIPGASLVEIEGGSHALPMTQPDRIADITVEFLAEAPLAR